MRFPKSLNPQTPAQSNETSQMCRRRPVPRLIPAEWQTVDKALLTFKNKTKSKQKPIPFFKHKRRALRLAEKGRGETCLCFPALHKASCKIQPRSTDLEGKWRKIQNSHSDAENKSAETFQLRCKAGRATCWHSLYLTNETSGQHFSGKALGHSSLTTPLHPEWNNDYLQPARVRALAVLLI